MAKRTATSELNHENWDQEEESEDPGTFKSLSSKELKNRIIKKAKRSLKGNKAESTGSSPFAAFGGFSSSGSSTFSFMPKSSSSSFNAATDKEEEKKENGNTESNKEKESSKEQTAVSKSSVSNKQKLIRSIEYYRHLQSLNESVINWMQLHLSKNSCCDFTPVFNDYKKHLDTLNVTYPVKSSSGQSSETRSLVANDFFFFDNSNSSEKQSDAKVSNNGGHEFEKGSGCKKDDETDYGANFSSKTTNTSTFSFGIMRTPSATSSQSLGPTSSIREEAAPPEKKPFPFSFGLQNAQDSGKSFSFASAPLEKNPAAENADEESEYVPPKNECAPVKEENAFYSKKCKLFFKKDEGFVEKGVGFLHLKPIDGKTQLLIRADTTLGNILLNIILSASIPMSRTGKNNVLLVCVPNPPLNVKGEDSKTAIPMLIRVKTSEDADELLETLEKYKS